MKCKPLKWTSQVLGSPKRELHSYCGPETVSQSFRCCYFSDCPTEAWGLLSLTDLPPALKRLEYDQKSGKSRIRGRALARRAAGRSRGNPAAPCALMRAFERGPALHHNS